jgi:[CysO sulfur-carrier protein]-S-L-cysteine hydrolase
VAEVSGLTLSRAQWQEIIAHAQAELPNEACGLLAGEGGTVRHVYPVENSLHSPWAYEMDPTQQVHVMLEIEAAGWELSAIYHSHPGGPPVPSPTDVARAYYPDSIYLILAPEAATREWHGRAFVIEEGRVEELSLQVVE